MSKSRPNALALLIPTSVILWGLMLDGAWAQEVPEPTPQAVIERAEQAEPIRDLLTAHPEAKTTNVHFDKQFGCWVVEFVVEGRVVGFATVSSDGRKVLETSVQSQNRKNKAPRRDRGERLPSLLSVLEPAFAGGDLFWLAALVLLLTFFDFDRPFSRRNADVLSLLLLAPFLLSRWSQTRLAYAGLFLGTLYFFCRMLVVAWRPPPGPIVPNLGTRPLATILLLVSLFHLDIIRQRGVDDCGIFGTFGAQHLLAHAQMPYGQEHFGGGDTYGPLFYVLHVPFVVTWPPGYETDEGFRIIQEKLPPGIDYERLSFTAAKAVAALFDALLLLGLILVGRRWHSLRLGLALAVAYAILPYTIAGLNFSSHIVATACTVGALVCLEVPVLSGLFLSLGIGALFYPVFLLPLWLSYYEGRDRLRFGLVVAVVGAVCLGAVFVGESDWGRFIAHTWGQQEGVDHNGSSALGFWGQYPSRAWLKRPVLVAYGLFCLALLRWPRRKTEYRLVALSAAVLLGTQLWKTHSGGTYIEWYLPWLVMTLVGGPPRPSGAMPHEPVRGA